MREEAYPSRADIAAGQLEQLRTLLAELFPGNKFYTHKLNGAGITFDVASLEDFSTRFPFTTKAELSADQRGTPPFGTNLTYPLQRYTRYHQTSGTSGAPLRWLDTPEAWDGMVESWTRIFQAAGVKADDRVYFAFSFGPFIGFWLAFESAARLGCLCVPGGGLGSVARLAAILENQINVLCCTPTYALRLAETAAREKIPLDRSRVRKLIVAGEPGGSIPSVRARLEELWPGARVFDHHGMTETGPVTYQCPARAGVLHVIDPAYYAEVIQPNGSEPVKPGETGELVLTTLARTGSPVLRYRTGDVVKCGMRPPSSDSDAARNAECARLRSTPAQQGVGNGACECGSFEMAFEGGILGRTDDMVVVRGVNVYPSAVEEIVRACDGIAEYRLEVNKKDELAELTLQIEPSPECSDTSELVRKLEATFQTALALRVPVAVVPSGSLPRFDMKAKRWIVRP